MGSILDISKSPKKYNVKYTTHFLNFRKWTCLNKKLIFSENIKIYWIKHYKISLLRHPSPYKVLKAPFVGFHRVLLLTIISFSSFVWYSHYVHAISHIFFSSQAVQSNLMHWWFDAWFSDTHGRSSCNCRSGRRFTSRRC